MTTTTEDKIMKSLKERTQISEDWILGNITSNVDDRAALDGENLNTPKLKLTYLHQVFMLQGYIGRDNYTKELDEYLRGLPNILDIVWSNYDISLLLQEWGYTQVQAESHVHNYWNYTANRIVQLMKKYKVEV